LPADLAKVPSDGLLVVSGRLQELWASDFLRSVRDKMKAELKEGTQAFEQLFRLQLDQVERFTIVLLDEPRAQQQPLMFVRTTKPYELDKLLAVGKKAEAKKYKGETLYVADKSTAAFFPLDKQTLVYSESADALQALIDHEQPKTPGPLAGALRLAAGKHSLVFGVNVKMVNDTIGGMLPGEVEPFRPLLEASAATLTADIGAQTRVTSTLHFTDEKAAKAAVKPSEEGLTMLRGGLERGIEFLQSDKEAAEMIKLLRQFEGALKAAQIEQKGETLTASVHTKLDLAPAGVALLEAVQKVRSSASRQVSSNNLRQIAIAMHAYHDTNRGLPPQASYDKNGKPLLSWRVLILPYIEQQNLYMQFHLDEPWDSEHNKKLLDKMPKIYASPHDESTSKEHTTYYQGFVGKGAFFEGKQGLRFSDFTDGTSNTIMIVEAAKAVPWSKPEDIPFDPAKELPNLIRNGANGFQAALCDGSVRLISAKIKPETLKNLIIRNDGNVIDFNDL